MKILIDTNVIVDNLALRDEYEESLKLLQLCENGFLKGVITTVTVMDVLYIMRKHLSLDEVRDSVQILLHIVDLVPILKSDIDTALAGDFSDLEDAVQASCARRIRADYIVTRNVKDFNGSSVPAVIPAGMLKILAPANR